jgi:c-di-GMP-binding flagellar brake protein YcgR
MARRVAVHNPHWNPSQGSAILTDPGQILDVLGKSTRQLCSVSIKIRGSDQQFSSRLVDSKLSETGLQVEYSAELTEASFKQELRRTGSRDCLLMIFAGNRYILGINVECIEMGDVLTFNIPKKVFRMQRRKSVRYVIPTGYDMYVEMASVEEPHLRTRRKLLDISEHGLAFFVLSRREGALYLKNAVLKRCSINIRNHEIKVDLKVMNRIEHDQGKKGGGTKIGTEFTSISVDDLDLLTQFVYSQLAQMLT